MPGLIGDYFADTVTYICEHNDEGAMGIIVNRPLDMSLIEVLSQLNLPTPRGLAETQVLDGGPVATERGFVLHSADKHFESSLFLCDGLYLSTALDVLQAIANDSGPQDYCVALGYAGWDAGQLEDEIRQNIWLTVPAQLDVLFHTPPSQRREAAAAPLGIDFNLIAGRAGHA